LRIRWNDLTGKYDSASTVSPKVVAAQPVETISGGPAPRI